MKIEGFIFDLDGVLVDTAKYHFKAWKRTANSLGIEFNETHNEQLKGVARRASLEYILSLDNTLVLEEKEIEALLVQKNEWYLGLIKNLNQEELLPGSLELLEKLNSEGFKVALGSASSNAQYILRSAYIHKYFDAIIDGTVTTKSKPHPQVFQLGASELNLRPEQCIVFEDSIKGLIAANAGGFHSVGIGDPIQLHMTNHCYPSLQQANFSELKRKFDLKS